jgi:hypothetical protein
MGGNLKGEAKRANKSWQGEARRAAFNMSTRGNDDVLRLAISGYAAEPHAVSGGETMMILIFSFPQLFMNKNS